MSVLLGEYIKNNIKIYKRHFYFYIETTNFCNAQCEFCINPKLKRKKMFMSDEIFETVIQRIDDEKITPTGFSMHLNGEPLLDKKIFERINYLGDRFPNTSIEMTSNFKLANSEIIEKLLESKLDILKISLNAADEDTYQKRMHLSDFSGTLANAKSIVELNKNLMNPKKILVSIVENENNKKDVENLSNLMDDSCDIRVLKEGSWNRNESSDTEKGKKVICDAIYNTVCILSDGSYSLCCFDAEGKVGLNVMDTKIMDALESSFYKELRINHLMRPIKDSICRGCSRYL